MRIEQNNSKIIRRKRTHTTSDISRVKKIERNTKNKANSTRHRDANPTSTKRRLFFFTFLALIVLAVGVTTQQVFFSQTTVPALQAVTRLPIIREIRSVTGANDGQLKGESRDRINVLILGQGGAGHEGAYLSDTIMLASLKPSTGQVALLSIPRDMIVKIPGYGFDRINTANAYGEKNGYPGGGAAFAARVLEDTLKQPINYYVRIDFNGFEQIIDEIGGIKVNIDRSFTDEQYPTEDGGYQTVSFEKGITTLSGKKALQYVRSRHAPGELGDFSRARRQQKVIIALKDKLLTPINLLNPSKLTGLYDKLNKHISTNIQLWEIPAFMNMAQNADFSSISFKILDDSPAGPLYATTTEGGAFVLAPKIADYSEIQFIANNLFTLNDIKLEDTSLAIQNGTTVEGLAINTAEIMRAFDFKIAKVQNARSNNYQKTVLYDLTGNTKPSSKKFLEGTLRTKTQDTLPLGNDDLEGVDFLIILGLDQVPDYQADEKKS